MSDEQKNVTAVDVPKKEAAVEKPNEKKDASVEAAVESKTPAESTNKNEEKKEEEKKNKKINVMTLKEIEQAIEKTKKNQGGLFSRYAHELIARKEFLANNSKK